MLNPGYRKTELKDENGRILLPRTTASMISEEPNRRFMDSTEKKVISDLTSETDSLKEISSYVDELRLVVLNLESILSLLTGKEAIEQIGERSEELIALSEAIPALQQVLNGSSVQIRSRSSDNLYSLTINDTDLENPFVELVKVDEIEISEEVIPEEGE